MKIETDRVRETDGDERERERGEVEGGERRIKRDREQNRSDWTLEQVSRQEAGWTACLLDTGWRAYYSDADGLVQVGREDDRSELVHVKVK